MSETHKRSLFKAISWRVLATLTTMIVVFLFTGELFLAIGVGILDATIKILIYYGHERVWNTIKWGRS